MRKYTITLNEEQMLLISRCIEDISRFLGGDADLFHTVSTLKNWKEIFALIEWYLHNYCVENKTDNVTISAGGSELFTITAKGKLLEKIKEEIKEEQP